MNYGLTKHDGMAMSEHWRQWARDEYKKRNKLTLKKSFIKRLIPFIP